jgi:4-hydroxymandelate oxidase
MASTPDPQGMTRRQALTSFALAAGTAVATTKAFAQQAPLTPANAEIPSEIPPAVGRGGGRGGGVAEPASVPMFAERAKEVLPVPAWEFYDSGCADDITVRWNREALQHLRLESRVMVDVAKIDTRMTLFGHDMPHPILLAPTAAHQLAHPDGEVATARGANTAQATMILSSNANKPVEDVAAATTHPLWFQLYVSPDLEARKAVIARAEAAGCKALCITCDQPVIYTRDRVSRQGGAIQTQPTPNAGLGGRTRSMTWSDVEWFRSVTKMKIVLKGILHPDDAEQAVKAGADAIIVSNHGGRALDGVAPTIDALPRVADRVAKRIPVLMDGGIRRGSDIVRAFARGANAVMIGRPYLYGLAVNGADGVARIVQILRNEMEATMALTGRTSLAAIDRATLWPDEPRLN